jgi:glycosyltransferase involved in cell wall biosynthesis
MPRVSVIINCYNGEKYLKAAIDSVYAQTYEDWEIILWDDASADGSAEIAKSYDSRLRYFRGEKAASLGQARNFALKKAEGEFIAILDQDDLWMADKLETQLPFFERNPAVGLVFSDATDYYQDTGRKVSHFSNINVMPPRGRIFGYLFLFDNYPISMPTAIFRRAALNSLPERFDERFRYAEEYDLFLRISYEWECDYANKPLAIYRIHDSNSTKRFHKEMADELESIMEKCLNTYPELRTKFKKEIRINRSTAARQLAKSLWQTGQAGQARSLLLRHMCSSKNAATYAGTFFPYKRVTDLWVFLNFFFKKTREKEIRK